MSIKCLKCDNTNITLLRFNGFRQSKKLKTALQIINCLVCFSNYAVNDEFVQTIKRARLGVYV